MAFFYLFTVMMMLTSCENNIHHKGFQSEHAKISDVKIHHDTQADVRAKLGTPTVMLPYPDSKGYTVWYYVSRLTEDNTFKLPQVKDQKTYVLRFDKKGVLRVFEESAEHTDIEMNQNATQSETYESGVMRDVFGSFGRNMSKKAKS